jgi:hypothetical protein
MDRWHVSQIGRFSTLNCRPAPADWMIARLLAATMMSSVGGKSTRYPEECSELKTADMRIGFRKIGRFGAGAFLLTSPAGDGR